MKMQVYPLQRMSKILNPPDPAQNQPPSSLTIILYSSDPVTNQPQTLINTIQLPPLEQITASLAFDRSIPSHQYAKLTSLLQSLLEIIIPPATSPPALGSTEIVSVTSKAQGPHPLFLPLGTSPSLSFANVVKSLNPPPTSAISIPFCDRVAISILKQVATTYSSSFSFAALGGFLGKKPSLEWVEDSIKSSLNLSLPCLKSLTAKGLFLFRFGCKEDMSQTLSCHPSSIGKTRTHLA